MSRSCCGWVLLVSGLDAWWPSDRWRGLDRQVLDASRWTVAAGLEDAWRPELPCFAFAAGRFEFERDWMILMGLARRSCNLVIGLKRAERGAGCSLDLLLEVWEEAIFDDCMPDFACSLLLIWGRLLCSWDAGCNGLKKCILGLVAMG
ncbi:hypothetical protein ACLOJK_028297 [Asimina triloba]